MQAEAERKRQEARKKAAEEAARKKVTGYMHL